MTQKRFVQPRVIYPGYGINGMGPGGDDDDTGLGSGQTTTDPFEVDFNDWMDLFAKDLNNDEEVDEYDYYLWWVQQGFSEDAWNQFSGGLPWPYVKP